MLDYLPSPASKVNYSYHVKTYMAFVGSTPDKYVKGALQDTKHVQEDIAVYIEHLKGLTSRKGAPLSGNTIQSAINPIKALLEYNDVRVNEINWKRLHKLIPPARKFGKDGPKTAESESLSIGCGVENPSSAMSELKGKGVNFSREVEDRPANIALFTGPDGNFIYPSGIARSG